MLRVFVMRHGDRADDHEAAPEVQALVDRVEDPPLAPAGLAAAARVAAEHLAPHGPFDAVVASPMLRCVQTAAVVGQVVVVPSNLIVCSPSDPDARH